MSSVPDDYLTRRDEEVAKIQQALDETSSVRILKTPQQARAAKTYEKAGLNAQNLSRYQKFKVSKHYDAINAQYETAHNKRRTALLAALDESRVRGPPVPSQVDSYLGARPPTYQELQAFRVNETSNRVRRYTVDPVLRHVAIRAQAYNHGVGIPMLRDSLGFSLDEDDVGNEIKRR